MQLMPVKSLSTVFATREYLKRQGVIGLFKSAVLNISFNWLESNGYDMYKPEPYQRESRNAFFAAEFEARRRYEGLDQQTKLELPFMLNAKYEQTSILGTVRMYDAIEALSSIIDPLDPYLGCVSQLTHQLQLVQLMENDGMNEQFILCGLIHDLGKLLIKFSNEDPMNVEASGKKIPLHGCPGGGLLNCTFRWDHGDFAYLRIKDLVADEISWLVRHHSIDIAACEPYMDDRDREYTQRLLLPFAAYDDHKDMYALPKKQLADYQGLIDQYFPNEILI